MKWSEGADRVTKWIWGAELYHFFFLAIFDKFHESISHLYWASMSVAALVCCKHFPQPNTKGIVTIKQSNKGMMYKGQNNIDIITHYRIILKA